MKGGCLNTRSPSAMRKRIAAPVVEHRKLILDVPPTCSSTVEVNFQVMPGATVEPPTPVQNKMMEFNTPESGKRNSRSFHREEQEMQKSPETSLGSPYSVLNPPPSIKRRTIRDYFGSAS